MQPSPIKNENLLQMLRRTRRWRPAVAKTAALFADVPIVEYENLKVINYDELTDIIANADTTFRF